MIEPPSPGNGDHAWRAPAFFLLIGPSLIVFAATRLPSQAGPATWSAGCISILAVLAVRSTQKHKSLAIAFSAFAGMLCGFSCLYFFADLVHMPADTQGTRLDWADCLFFSVSTWTSLGHSIILPRDQPGRLIAGLQSVLGYLFLALTLHTLLSDHPAVPASAVIDSSATPPPDLPPSGPRNNQVSQEGSEKNAPPTDVKGNN